MKFITKNADRKLAYSTEQVRDVQWIILYEHEAYVPIGHMKRKWSDTRIAISREELAKLAKELAQ